MIHRERTKTAETLFTSRTCSEGRIVFHLSLFYLLAWSFASVVPFFVCLFSFSFARHILGFVMIVKVLKVFGKTLRIVRVNLTCFFAFSLVSDSFGNGFKDLFHMRHNAHESTGVVTGSSGVWFNQNSLFHMDFEKGYSEILVRSNITYSSPSFSSGMIEEKSNTTFWPSRFVR